MPSVEEILKTEICECGEKNVGEAVEIFQHTELPFKKAKKLVTGCNKNCCRQPLMKLFDMVYFGKYDYDEIYRLIKIRHDKLKKMVDELKN
ncbi:MAG: hypothetical protein K0U47_09175 [Epsilonproteobacteria bacterium]|nr:hypothetical protein [Campylobacterota bacterium]